VTTIYTVGHSNHTLDTFLSLLRMHGINAVVDVRSSPYSRFAPHCNKDVLPGLLQKIGATYLFMGSQLGARPCDSACYRNGSVDFSRLAQAGYFQDGLAEIRRTASQFSLSLMCSERDPILCHRMILIGRHLRGDDMVIRHIRENGDLEDNRDAEGRVLALLRMAPTDLFRTPEGLVEEAYDRQGERIAYHGEEEVAADMGVAHA
jgi:uncharacterized protein (DUF488 family)